MVRHFFAITLFTACLGLIPAAHASDVTENFTFTKPPKLLPSFIFEDAKGQVLDLKNFRGRYVLLNIWATWCGPCAREMPSLDDLARKLAEDTPPPEAKPITISTASKAATPAPLHPRIEIIPLTEDHEGLTAAQGFYKRHNLHYLKVFVDKSGEAPSILQVDGFPTTFLIDPRGREIGHLVGGADWNDPETIAFLKAQMKAGGE